MLDCSQIKNEKMRVGVGLLLDEDCHNSIRELQINLLSRGLIKSPFIQEPHITIKSPFEISTIQNLANYLDEKFDNTKEIIVKTSSLDLFDKNILYQAVSKNKILLDLHYDLIKFCNDKGEYEGENKVFHITIGRSLSKQILEEQIKFKKNTCSLIGVGIFLYNEETKSWIVVYKKKFIDSDN